MLGTMSILTLGIYKFANERLPVDLIVSDSQIANLPEPDAEAELAPLEWTTLTDDRVLVLLLFVAGAFAASAIALGLFGMRRTNNDHFLTTGVVFGCTGILWIGLIALGVL